MQGKSLKKAIIQGTVTAFVFLASWFALSQVGWMQVLKVEDTKRNLEQKLGDIFMDVFRDSQDELEDEFVKSTIDSLLSGICTRNDIEKSDIKVHIFETGEINAFALPDGHMILNTGLILSAENQEELCGVICHELAHIESGHVMKMLIKDGLIYTVTTRNIMMCIDAKTGQEVWTERQKANFNASPVYADGNVWFFSVKGEVLAIRPGRKYEVAAQNQMDSGIWGTPAFLRDAVILRTENYLCRIE